MKTNNLLTYLLYALLGLLIIAAGYKACQMQQDKKDKAAEEAELQKTLRDMGYANDDTTSLGSTYSGDTSTTSTTSSSGIERDPVTSPSTSTTATTPKPATSTTKPATPAATTSKPTATTSTEPKTTAVTTTTKGSTAAKKGPGTGRWAVRAGTFTQMDGARRRLEEVIRLGYTNAEISKTSSGNAAVVVFRSNDKNAAIRVVDNLEEKGVDAAVFDRNKKD